jgi:hypothetical protein
MIITRLAYPAVMIAVLLNALAANAASVYQQPSEFIAEAFSANTPAPKALWINDEIRDAAHKVLHHDLRPLRIKYWQIGPRTVWILDEIGKDLPITTGVVVDNGQIESIQVLVFRESRGWEVRYPFFTDQFAGAELVSRRRLDRDIDNISGATLSVKALTRQATLALLLTTFTEGTIEE